MSRCVPMISACSARRVHWVAMLITRTVNTKVRRTFVLCAAPLAIALASCGSPSAATNAPHLASIQSAVVCPIPPAHNAVAKPSRTFSAAPTRVIKNNVGYCAYIATKAGIISVRLRPEYAPNAVNDFVFLVEHGFYDGQTFAQACPATTGTPCPTGATALVAGNPVGTGAGSPGFTVKADPVIGQYLFGAVAMYGSNASTVGSRFFISTGDSSKVARDYDIFGQVTDGIPALASLQKGATILWITVVATAPEP
jgi:cyclophilin family peptidyl-prolyl cis-trans isomerase